ncbi:nuclease-related domain-containing protein [Streptomyces sp. DSM 41534]
MDRQGARAAAQARSWGAGEVGEQRTAAILAPLAAEGWAGFYDRRIPGLDRANADHVLVSPGGRVFMPDSKMWHARARVRVVRGRLTHGDVDKDRQIDGVLMEAKMVGQALGATVTPLIAIHNAPVDGGGFMLSEGKATGGPSGGAAAWERWRAQPGRGAAVGAARVPCAAPVRGGWWPVMDGQLTLKMPVASPAAAEGSGVRTYWEHCGPRDWRPVTVRIRYGQVGGMPDPVSPLVHTAALAPRNVLVEREDGAADVRPVRLLRIKRSRFGSAGP